MTGQELAMRSLIRRHGAPFVRALVASFEALESDAEIGRRCHVSRECVGQWRDLLGVTLVRYEVFPDVAAIADGVA